MSMKPLCIDTSFLIDLWVEYHTPEEWPLLWSEVIPSLIEKNLFFAPHEVYEELSGKAAPLKKWAYDNREMFRIPDKTTCVILRDVLKNNPSCVDRYKRGPHADSLVVAMAKATGAIAVTRERRDGLNPSLRKPKVHTLCKENQVDCYVTVREFRKHIGWPSN